MLSNYGYNTALVTGGSGFIGSHIVDNLLQQGLKVICVDNLDAGDLNNNQNHLKNPNFLFFKVDVSDYSELEPLFAGVDIVFHEAASKNTVCMNNPSRDLAVNALGTLNVLEAARKHHIKKIVHASTGSVYGEPKIFPTTEEHPLNPVSLYGISKTAGESYARFFFKTYGMNITILRYFHVFGPRQSDKFPIGGVIPIFINQNYHRNQSTIFGDGEQVRSFTFVKDIVSLNNLVAINPDTAGETYNCASGIQVSINNLYQMISDIMNYETNLEKKDPKIGDIRFFNVDNSKIKSISNYDFTNFSEGLKITIDWYLKKYSLKEK